MKRIIVFIIFTAFWQWAEAQKYSNEFLAIGVGGRAQAMGNAAVASTTDSYAGYWNSAGIAGVETNMQLSFMHAEWFAGIGNYDYLSFVYPIDNKKKDITRSVGFSIIRFGIDNIPNTLSLYEDDGTVNYDNIKPFSAADYAFKFNYAQSIWVGSHAKLYIGGDAKVIYRKIGPFAKATGFGFDFGLQYHLKNWSLGLSAKDVTNTFNAWKFEFTEDEKETLDITGNDIPINSLEVTRPWFILGVAYKNRFGKLGFLTELDLKMNTDGQRNTLVSGGNFSMDPSWGLEFDYNEIIYLRAGVSNFQKETNIENIENWNVQPSLGIGLGFQAIRVDYAFTDISNTDQKNYSHVVSLLLDFDFDFFKSAFKAGKRN